jgi:hypothetical protein
MKNYLFRSPVAFVQTFLLVFEVVRPDHEVLLLLVFEVVEELAVELDDALCFFVTGLGGVIRSGLPFHSDLRLFSLKIV